MLVTVKLNPETQMWDLIYGKKTLGDAVTKAAAIVAASDFVKSMQPHVPINVGNSFYEVNKAFVCTNVPVDEKDQEVTSFTSQRGTITLTEEDIQPLKKEVDLLSLINI